MHLLPIPPLPKGSQIFEYRFLEAVGQGGFGTTYRCQDVHLGKIFAIKEYTPHFLADRLRDGRIVAKSEEFAQLFHEGLRDFLTEAKRLANFSHPNIIPVTRFFEANQTGYFVMEYQSGGSLRGLLREKRGRFSESEIRAIIAPLSDAIKELHAAKIIHRDIKPDNIMLGRDGAPIIIDFGATISLIGLDRDMLEMISTPGYAPPEQIIPGAPQGDWVDVYAIGATLYELMTGDSPPPSQERMLGRTFLPATRAARGKYSTQLLELVDACLELDYKLRPQSVKQLLGLLAPPVATLCQTIAGGVSNQMLRHFMNFANPNDGLRVNELVSFIILFPLIDLGWRIGTALPNRESLGPLLENTPPEQPAAGVSELVAAGFTNVEGAITHASISSRVDEYCAAYLLDRQEEDWDYALLCRQAARNCIEAESRSDIKGFSELLSEVVDRARGRILKAYRRELSPLGFALDNKGWKKVVAG